MPCLASYSVCRRATEPWMSEGWLHWPVALQAACHACITVRPCIDSREESLKQRVHSCALFQLIGRATQRLSVAQW